MASQYAPKIQPWLDATKGKELFDALELGTLCNQNFDVDFKHLYRGEGLFGNKAGENATSLAGVFVSPSGSNNNDGSIDKPLATIEAAVNLTRTRCGS